MKARKLQITRFGRTRTAKQNRSVMLHLTFGNFQYRKQTMSRCGNLLAEEVKGDIQSTQLCPLCQKWYRLAQLAFNFGEPATAG